MNEQAKMINVEEIMKNIKEQFRETTDSISFHEEIMQPQNEIKRTEGTISQPEMILQLNNEISCLKAYQNNPYYTELGGGIKGLIKRVVRKLNKPLLFPMSERQNIFNEHVGNAVDVTRVIELQHEERLNTYYHQIRELETRLNTTMDQIKGYQAQISYLTEKNEEMSRALTIYKWRLFDHLGIDMGKKEGT